MFILLLILFLLFLSIAYMLYNSKRYQKRITEELRDLRLENKGLLYQLANTEVNISRKLHNDYQEKFAAWTTNHEKEIRKDANKRQKSVLRGQSLEHIAPFLIKDTIISDYRFFGAPIDFIHIKGLSAVADGEKDEIEEIVFLEIKSGKSQLNKIQRRIRDCIKEGRVKFEIFNVDKS